MTHRLLLSMKTVNSLQNNIMKNKILEQSSCPEGYRPISASDVPNHDPSEVKKVGDIYCLKNKNTSTPPPKPNTIPAPTKDEICNGKVVSEGMKGDIVWMIQNKLSSIGLFKKNLTNNFGTETKKAVVNFQTNNRDKLEDKSKPTAIVVDGKVGPNTWNLLFQGTEHACKKIENTPTEVKPEVMPTEVKPKVMPNKIRKPITPLDVKSPEKYSVRIGEQTEYTNQAASQPQTNQVAATQPKTENPAEILKRVINTGCIEKLKKEIGFELKGRPESQPRKLTDNRYAIIGVNNSTEELIYLFSDGTGKKVKVDENNQPTEGGTENIEWECADFKKSTSLTADKNQMTADQADYVDDMVAKGAIQITKPSDYETNQGKWKWVDLHELNPGIFKERNKFFVYQQSGLMGKKRNQYPEVERVINDTGWTLDEPPMDTYAYQTREDIRNKFPQFREKFPNGLTIYNIGNTRSKKQQQLVSDLISDIKKSVDSPDNQTCRDAVNILWDAKQVYNKKIIYFTGDTELETVRNYVKQCQVKLEKKGLLNIFNQEERRRFEILKDMPYGPTGESKFNLYENLNSLIRKKLLSIKEQK